MANAQEQICAKANRMVDCARADTIAVCIKADAIVVCARADTKKDLQKEKCDGKSAKGKECQRQ